MEVNPSTRYRCGRSPLLRLVEVVEVALFASLWQTGV
jgi:hypothetical protein